MGKKLIIVMVNTDTRNGEELGAPLATLSAALAGPLKFERQPLRKLVAELRRIDREALQLLKIITEKQRLLGDYLQKLNQKIDLIARHSMFSSGESGGAARINLSEEGVAFRSDRALYKGNFLVLRMIFLPNYTPVIVFASVSRCEDEGDDGYRIGAKFHRLREQDRQELARQIIRAQVSHRKRSSTPENNQ